MSKIVTCIPTRWLALLCAAALVGCGGGSSNGNDRDAAGDLAMGGRGGSGRGGSTGAGGTAGARADAAADSSGGDARPDAGIDAQASPDARPDAQADAGPDGDVDAGTDAPPFDAPADQAVRPDGPADGYNPDAATDLPPAPDGATDAPPPPPESYVAALSGAEEIPAVDTSASGVAMLTYEPGTRSLSWTVSHNVTGATAAGIYTGGAGEAGAGPITVAATSPATGMATLTAQQEADLRLGHLHINVRSGAQAGGEIRGQILRPGETLWVARLTGAEEIPANNLTGTAAFSLIVNAAHTSAHYRVTTSLAPTAGHIHAGVAGVAGDPIVVFSFAGSTAEADIAMNDNDFTALSETRLYTNVHTTEAANGQIRGQILRAGSQLFVSTMTGLQEAPPVVSSGTGSASVVLDYRSTTVRYAVVTSLSPIMGHIHPGIAGASNPPVLTFSNLGAAFAGAGTLAQAQVDALQAGQLYTNLHTTAFSTGEIRGQLLRPGERLFVALLSGANEVPANASTATGAVQFVLNTAATSLRYQGLVTGLADATAALLLNAPAGMAGPQVATLTLMGLNPVGTLPVSAGDVASLGASLYYVDIHSTARPTGEIRGQIAPR